MAIFHMEGFDSGTASTGDSAAADMVIYLNDKYTGSTENGSDVRAQTGWGGVGKCLSMGKDTSASSNFIRFDVPEATTYYGMFAFNPRIIPSTGKVVEFEHIADAVTHVTLVLVSGGQLQARRGSAFGTILGTTGPVLRPGRWNHIRFKITISNTVGEVTIWVNGVQKLNLTSQDTRNGGSGDDMDAIDIWGMNAVTPGLEDETCYDDIVISDTEITDILKVEDLLPNAAGDLTDWTPDAGSNFQRCDEVPKDGDTTYVESSTNTDTDLYNMASLTTVTGNIKAVQVNLDARATAGSENIRTKVKTGTTTVDGASQAVSDTSNFDTFSEIEEVDPDTAVAWIVSGVNAMQCGVEHL